MAIAWPVGLPQYVLVDGYGEDEADNLIEYGPDIGPPISRPRSSAAARQFDIVFNLSRAQLATLRTFFRTTLISGSLPFTIPAPSVAGNYTVKFRKGSQPKMAALGGNWFRVTCGLWILP